MTLQEIGEIIGVTRMRVCQLEKKIINEIKDDAEMSRAN
jgi:DNA-directed RNA polymerase specialized sigma subunit